jgi:hypothetical protein
MTEWYWCLKHERVEREDERDAATQTLGPYPSEIAARNWRETHDQREETWKQQDRDWTGEDEDEDDSRTSNPQTGA